MTFLLDTHLLLWALAEPHRLPGGAAELIASEAEQTISSAVAIWEISIKFALRKGIRGDMPIPGSTALNLCEMAGIKLLAVTPAHAAALDDLPRRHGDPFDRMLIAQATIEDVVLLTHDRSLAAYGSMVKIV